MDDRSVSRSIAEHLSPGENIVYQAPRNWSRLAGDVVGLLLVLLMGAVYVFFSGWQLNVAELSQIPMFATQSNAAMVQGMGIVRWAVPILGVCVLIASIRDLAALLWAKAAVTDRRIFGRTGRYILRRFDIPLDRIAWVDFPNDILTKGPITIHTKDGKHTTLWYLAKPKILLGYLEAGYAPESRPVIHKQTRWGKLALLVVAIIALGILAIYIAREFDGTPAVDSAPQSDGAPTQPGETEPVAVVEAATPEPTGTPSLPLGSPGTDRVIAFNQAGSLASEGLCGPTMSPPVYTGPGTWAPTVIYQYNP